MERTVKWVTGFTLILLAATAIYGILVNPGSGPDFDYGLFYDGVFFSLLTLGLYFNYERLNFDLLSYSLLMFLILFHIGGAFWWYGTHIGVIEFDMVIHAVGGAVLSIFFYRYITKFADFQSDFRLAAIIVLVVLGLSVIHELMEFFGYNFFGEGVGVFQYGVGDLGEYNDIAWDFISNLIGAIPGAWAAVRFYEK